MFDVFILLVFYTYVFSIWYKVVLKTEFCPLELEHISSTAGAIIFVTSHQVLDGTLETSNHCQITKVFILYVSNCVCINFLFNNHHDHHTHHHDHHYHLHDHHHLHWSSLQPAWSSPWSMIVQDEKFHLGPTRSYESIKDCMLTAWLDIHSSPHHHHH